MKSAEAVKLGITQSAAKLLAVVACTMGGMAYLPASASAEKPLVNLEVRIIKARHPVGEAVEGKAHKLNVDDDVVDLESSLSTLPFSSFVQVRKLEKLVEIKQKVGFSLCSGQTLIVRPLYKTGDQVGLWLRWIDADGASILDTRMHMDGEHPIIIGNEDTVRQTGKVLALSVKPDPLN